MRYPDAPVSPRMGALALTLAVALLPLFSGTLQAHPAVADQVDYPYVAGFDRFHQPEDDDAEVTQGGLLLLSELNCVACHAAPEAWKERLPGRAKLSLTGVGSRLSEDDLWLYVRSPQHRKKGTTMPGMFTGENRDDVALEALTRYLGSQKVAVPTFPQGEIERGRLLYHTTGCVACHEPAKVEDYRPPEAPPDVGVERPGLPSVPIILADRYDRNALAAFLLNPLATRPDGRMPATPMSEQDAADIAAYLHLNREGLQVTERAILKIGPTTPEQGRAAFVTMRCASCHDLPVEPGAKAALPADSKGLDSLRPDTGCLSLEKKAGVPDYSLSAFQRRALTLALKKIQQPPTERTALEKVDAFLLRMNCYACHEWRGTGGPEEPRAQYFTTLDPTAHSLGELGRMPPKLDNAGRKITRAWLERLFWGEGGGVRPYMTARMPHFGQENMERLIPDLEEACRIENPPKIDTTGLLKHHRAELGRVLMGTGVGGMGCVACHGLKDRKSLGVPVVNLTHTVERLRPEYFKELLLNPQVTQPGTLMPPLFIGRKKSGQEIEEIWTYLKELDQNRLPEGLLQTGDYELRPEKEAKPIVFRTFLVGAGMQAVAVGYPQGFNVAFDALEVRWAIAWKGRFLDAMSTWEERAMTPAKPLGTDLQKLPAHMPLAQLKSQSDPWPEDYGPAAGFVFKGYRLGKDGVPRFLYEVKGVKVEDELRVAADGKSLHRTVTLSGGSGSDWYFLGNAKDASPELVSWKNGEAKFEEVWTW